MPNVRNQRTSYEVAAQWGVPLDELLSDGATKNKRLTEARKAYAEGLADGSVIADPPRGGGET